MSRTLRQSALRLLCVATVIAAGGSCESSTAPRGSPSGQIPVGQVVSGSLAVGDSSRMYTFSTTAGSGYVIYANASQGTLELDLLDSLRTSATASVFFGASGTGLTSNPVLQFTVDAGGTRTIVVKRSDVSGAVSYQLLVYRVNDAPENRPAQFTIGNTVTGETIDPTADVDVFTAHVAAGQDIVVAAQAPNVAGLGPLILAVLDSTGTGSLGSASFATGVPDSVTTGRIHVVRAGTYQFRFESTPQWGATAFHGPYEFWTYAINRAPEHHAAAVPLDSAVVGESVDRTGDVDEFTFTAPPGSQVNAFFQSAVRSHLEIAPDSGAPLGSVSAGADTGLFARSTGRITLPAGGTYIARISGDGTAVADTGAYRFFLYPIDPRPEHVPAAIVPGDTISGESIDLPGDVDEFTFTATAGDEYYAFLQAQSGDSATHLRLDAVNPSDSVVATVQSVGTDTSLLRQITTPFTVPTTGTYRLRVSGAAPGAWAPAGSDSSTGPYRLFLYRVNRKPESVADTLALGDSLVGEAIDPPGDVDEYRFHVTDTTEVNFYVAFAGVGDLQAEIIDSVTDSTLATTLSPGKGATGATGALRLTPGTYIARVEAYAWDSRPYQRGPYELWLFTFGPGPETVHDTVAIGDTVQGESIDVPGDVDTYHFHGSRGQHINVMIQGTGTTTSSDAPSAFITGPWGITPPYAVVSSGADAAALSDHQTMRMDLPATGWYTMTVTAGGQYPSLTQRGPYRFAVVPVGTAPESVRDTLAIGDSLTAESIDVPGDWDQFTVTATPGQELYALFGSPGPCCIYPYVLVFDPATADTLAYNVGQGTRIAGPFVVPASGSVAIAAYEPPSVFFRQCYDATCEGIYRYTGPYSLQVLALNRAPETAPAAYTLGDTVSTESIYPAGDIDEFTLTATPGDTLSAWFRLRAAPSPAGSTMTLKVVDAATGAVLTPDVGLFASDSSFLSIGQFVVPASGRLLIRVLGWGLYGTGIGTAPYAFFVKRGP